MILIDSHCHLDYINFADDIEHVIERAMENNVKKFLSISTKIDDFPKLLKIVEKFENVFCTVGVHPHYAKDHKNINSKDLIDLSKHKKVIGIGETGLDFFYNHSDESLQEKLFYTHIEASQETKLPLIIHTREAEDKTAKIIKEEMKRKSFKAVLHCFSSSQNLADIALDLGMYLSFSGMITFKKAQAVRDTVKATPLDRILVETDSPFLSPTPHRGKRNEPAYTRYVAAKIAEIKGVPLEVIAKATTENFERLFGYS